MKLKPEERVTLITAAEIMRDCDLNEFDEYKPSYLKGKSRFQAKRFWSTLINKLKPKKGNSTRRTTWARNE